MKTLTTKIAVCTLLAAATGLAGCEPKEDGEKNHAKAFLSELDSVAVDDPAKLLEFSAASAPNIYWNILLPMFAGATDAEDESCPSVSNEGMTTTIRGGCTDSAGKPWYGTMRMTAAASGFRLAFDDYGFDDPNPECDFIDGFLTTSLRADGGFVIEIDDSSPGGGAFSGSGVYTLGSVDPACQARPDTTIGWNFSGDIENGPDDDGDGEPDYSIWNGSGSYGSSKFGKVEVTTVDERLDGTTVGGPSEFAPGDECLSEAASGSTTLVGGGRTAVIHYDGATDCDESGTVTWTLDGADQGEVEGIGCSVARTPVAGSASILLVLGALGLVFSRRRS